MKINLINMLIRFFPFYLLLFSLNGWSQNTVKDSLPQIQLLSRVQENQILLRWAVNEPMAWQKTNSTGFVLEKYVLFKNGKRLLNPEKLWSKSMQAAPLATWQEIVEKNNYAAIIAQAIYGESFTLEGSQGELADIVNQSQEAVQRFSFALLAADMNFEAAVKAGWGYTDLDVKPNERYVYKIKSTVPQEQLPLKGSAVLAGITDYEPLPAPIDVQAIFGDKNAIIAWEYELFKSIYTSYILERSENGKQFTPLSTEPLVNLNDKPNAPVKRMYYIDSLAQNDKTYYYRLHGISSFGEYGKYSDTISGQGKPNLSFTPRISDFKFTNKPNEAVIYWEYPKEGEGITEKFQLNQAAKDSGPYHVVVDNIEVTQREITYSELEPANYFTITAVGKTSKQQKTSYSTLVQPLDTIPPAVPIELKGEIDSLGIARFNWMLNEEKDFLGYRIFRGFTEKEEASQITISPIASNQFVDTVDVKNLNSKVYYQVVAVDKRFNHSEKSVVLALEKPDLIPPTAPVFTNFKVVKGQVVLQWVNSSEENATHILSRKNTSDNSSWQEVYKATDTIQRFVDKEVMPEVTYKYAIKAIDKNGLESPPSSELTVDVIDLSPPELIKEINFNVYREDNYIELFWRANDTEIAEYTIYKQENDTPATTWRIVPVNIKRVIDENVNPNMVYTYHLRGTMINGKFSQIKKIQIKY